MHQLPTSWQHLPHLHTSAWLLPSSYQTPINIPPTLNSVCARTSIMDPSHSTHHHPAPVPRGAMCTARMAGVGSALHCCIGCCCTHPAAASSSHVHTKPCCAG